MGIAELPLGSRDTLGCQTLPLSACNPYGCYQHIGPGPKFLALSSLLLVKSIPEWDTTNSGAASFVARQEIPSWVCDWKKVKPSERNQCSMERNFLRLNKELRPDGLRGSALQLLKDRGQEWYSGSSSPKGAMSLWACNLNPSFSWNHKYRSFLQRQERW